MKALALPKVKIVSNGTGRGTRVFDGDGREILYGCIQEIECHIDRGGPRVSILLTRAEVEIEGCLEKITAPVDRAESPP